MKAIGTTGPRPVTHPSALIAFEAPEPSVGPRDLLVDVRATALNPVDYKVRASRTPDGGAPSILGYDAAGVVIGVGDGVSGFKIGDEVFYSGQIDRPGSNAERQAVDERIVGPKPRSLSFVEAAALPLTFMTAWELLFDRMRVDRREDETLLVIGGAGGVGSALIQLARALTRLTVVATASRPKSRQWCLDLGAHQVIDHSEDISRSFKDTGLEAARYIASLTQTERHFDGLAQVIAPQGVLGVIDEPRGLPIEVLKDRSVTVAWEFLYTRPIYRTRDMDSQSRILAEIAALADEGRIRTTLTETLGRLSPETLLEGHRRLESGSTIGKLALEGFQS